MAFFAGAVLAFVLGYYIDRVQHDAYLNARLPDRDGQQPDKRDAE